MFSHLMYSDINCFEETSSGKLISRFTNDVNMMRDTLSKSLVGLVKKHSSIYRTYRSHVLPRLVTCNYNSDFTAISGEAGY